MEKDAEKFLKAEETAVKLVETLKQLHTEATSYQTATKELDTVRQRLLNLIISTEKIAGDSHEVIKILKEIGGPEILNRLTKVENRVCEEFGNQSKILNDFEKKTFDRFTSMVNKVNEEFTKQSKSLQNLKIFIIMTLISSVIAIIIGIIALLR